MVTNDSISTEYVSTDDLVMTTLLERLASLEQRLDNEGWMRLGDLTETGEFSLIGLKAIASMARVYFLKNPLIGQGVNVSSNYTFGRGISVNAADEEINTVVQAFLADTQNQAELTSHQAMIQKDRELQCDGNIFLCFFIHPLTGHVRVRSIPFQEIDDVICNPDDKKQPWYYKRVWTQKTFDPESGTYKTESKKAYYRDWRFHGDTRTTIENVPIADATVFHVKTGGFSDWKFGINEFYSANDWARAYKDFLTNWATLMQAYARFATNIKVKGGSQAVSAVKARLNTTVNIGNAESNPPATAGSTFISESDKIVLDVVKTAGATTKAEEGRRLALMAAAGQGLPETFYGDVSVGTLATAESLDRPTELKFSNRQELWQSVLKQIVWYVVEQSVRAVNGLLAGLATVVTNEYEEEIVQFAESIDTLINVDFPEIISISIKDHVAAIISVATLDGKQPVTLDLKTVTTMLLNALGTDDVDQLVERLFPEDAETQENATLVNVAHKLLEALNVHG